MLRPLLLYVFSLSACLCEPQGNLFGNIMGNLGGLGQMLGGGRQQNQPMQQQGGMQGMGNLGGLIQGVTNSITSLVQGGDILNDLKGLNREPADWSQKANQLCARYPSHPNCQGGRRPEFNQLSGMIEGILREGGKFLPKVPFLNIHDPLAGIGGDLGNLARAITTEFGAISQLITNRLLGVCRSMNCRAQTPKNIQMKGDVIRRLYDFEKRQTRRDNTAALNLRADRTQQIKQANLGSQVTAADTGVFDSDILLTDDQQNFMLNELGKAGVGSNTAPPRSERASVYFYENPAKHWDMPIPYTFDSSLEEYDKNDIRAAIQEIEQKTCVRFKYVTNPTGHHINYQKVDSATFCGLSHVGRADPANPVYLSFQCGNARGVALHETMHALGVAHQHLRPDRDQHINIDWSNVNPQYYDMFAVVDSKMYTSYGVKYDYGSIMHYNAYTGAVNIAKATMIPKVNPGANQGLLGQRNGMSASDVEIVKKMYCWMDCGDMNVYCGAWALQNLCGKNNWVTANCKKSCNYCKGAGK